MGDQHQHQIAYVDAQCVPQPERPAPYRVRASYERGFDAGGDLGVRDVMVLEYQSDPEHASAGTAERFYFGRSVGWFLWTRGQAHVAFNRIGGVARLPSPWCARDFGG
jgi:hypothetical protein